MTIDYRALCAALLQAWDDLPWEYDFSPLAEIDDAPFERARAALAQPEPMGPTDEELKAAYWDAFVEAAPCGADESWLAGLRAVARWGRPAIAPIPVSERLPGPEDCDAEGTCWMWHPVNFHYCLCRPDPSVHSHWLPANALPLPATT